MGSTADSKAHQTWYPTKLRGYRQAKGYKDPVDSCLRNAEKMGIKVFLGLNFNADWWAKAANDPTWLYAQMDEGNRIADELYARYKAKYPKAFHGWYWVWEVDNLNYNQPAQKQTLAKALEINVSHLHRMNRDMPVMLCPFMNYRVGVNANGYRDLWKYVFANTSLGKGDIFCPQDCVGAGGLTLDKLAEWFAALKQAVDSKPGLRFWVDTETFDQTDWTSGTMDRLVQQLRLVRPYVDTAITFAWSHYYSPNNAAAGWQKTWKDYMANRKLDAQPPTEPVNFKILRQGDGSVRVSWLPSSDNIGVCGYDIYRNGTRITRHQSGRETKPTVYVDTSAPVSERCRTRFRHMISQATSPLVWARSSRKIERLAHMALRHAFMLVVCIAVSGAFGRASVFTDDERAKISAYWNEPGRYKVTAPLVETEDSPWKARLTPDASRWFWSYQRAISAGKNPPSVQPVGSGPSFEAWETWVTARHAYDKWAAGEGAIEANLAVRGKQREKPGAPPPPHPGPIPPDLLAAAGNPPPLVGL